MGKQPIPNACQVQNRSYPLRGLLILLALLVSSIVHGVEVTPLTAQERGEVIKEINLMAETNVEDVTKFVVREATPDRIERFYLSPDVLHLPTRQREHGLIFAGKGSKLMSFEKPSDVLLKISSWFPEELAKARAQRALWPDSINLKGPYANWEPEPAAFVALWKCMPRIAWLMPDRLPFPRRFIDNNSLIYPLAATNVFWAPANPSQTQQQGYSDALMLAGIDEYEFGFCIWQRLGNLPSFGMEQLEQERSTMHADVEAVTPLLRRKFANFLAKNRCDGKGPDDCVLVLRLWASLGAGDAALASALKMLEPDIWPGLPQPKGLTAGAGAHEFPYLDEKNIDPVVRRASFLRTKLLSLLVAPDQWPSSALATTLRQMTELGTAYAGLYAGNTMNYDHWAEMGPVNPWSVLSVARDKAVLEKALLGELTRLGREMECANFGLWIEHVGQSLKTSYEQREIASDHLPSCTSPDWQALANDDDPQSRQVRDQYLALINHVSGDVLNMLLFGLTDHGQKCFGRPTKMAPWQRNVCERWISEIGHVSGEVRDIWLSEPTDYGQKCFGRTSKMAPWLRNVCERWISEPQAVHYSLKHSRLNLTREKKFAPVKLASGPRQNNLENWLLSQVRARNAALARDIRGIARKLGEYRVEVRDASMWSHRKSNKSLLVLEKESSDAPWPYGSTRLLLVVGPESVTVAGVPPRFAYQYDEGQLAQISDLDADGNMEVWFLGSWGECDGEDSRPGVDCDIQTINMGEIHGDVLSYFSRSAPVPVKRNHKQPTPTSKPWWKIW